MFHWILFIICQHWPRLWHGTTSHYLNLEHWYLISSQRNSELKKSLFNEYRLTNISQFSGKHAFNQSKRPSAGIWETTIKMEIIHDLIEFVLYQVHFRYIICQVYMYTYIMDCNFLTFFHINSNSSRKYKTVIYLHGSPRQEKKQYKWHGIFLQAVTRFIKA